MNGIKKVTIIKQKPQNNEDKKKTRPKDVRLATALLDNLVFLISLWFNDHIKILQNEKEGYRADIGIESFITMINKNILRYNKKNPTII